MRQQQRGDDLARVRAQDLSIAVGAGVAKQLKAPVLRSISQTSGTPWAA
jgi:hypothetical protein